MKVELKIGCTMGMELSMKMESPFLKVISKMAKNAVKDVILMKTDSLLKEYTRMIALLESLEMIKTKREVLIS